MLSGPCLCPRCKHSRSQQLRADCACLGAAINAMHTNNGQGNPELSNLPRKLNIGLSPSRDDFPHTHINDVGLVAVKDSDSGEVRHLLGSVSV